MFEIDVDEAVHSNEVYQKMLNDLRTLPTNEIVSVQHEYSKKVSRRKNFTRGIVTFTLGALLGTAIPYEKEAIKTIAGLGTAIALASVLYSRTGRREIERQIDLLSRC